MNRRRERILEEQVMERLFTRIVPKMYNSEDASDVAQIESMMWEGGSGSMCREVPPRKKSGELSTLPLREAVAEAKSIARKSEQFVEEGMAVLNKMLEEFNRRE